MTKEKKEPKVKTIEDKGTKIDFVDFGNGRQTFIFREEKFRGIQIAGFRLGWSEKYKVISPQELTKGTLSVMSTAVTNVSGEIVVPKDFDVRVEKEEEEEDEW